MVNHHLGYKYRMPYANLLQKHVSQKVFKKKKKKKFQTIFTLGRVLRKKFTNSQRYFFFSNQSFESLHIADSKEEIICLL